MKAYSLFVLTALSAGAQTSTSVALTNQGFEAPYNNVNGNGGKITGRTAAGWTDNSAWANATVQYAQESSNPHSGASCQKITVASVGTGEMQLQQGFPLHAGNIYMASAWMRGLPGTIAKLRVQQGSSPYIAYLETAVSLTADWQQVSMEAYITTSEAATLMIAASSAGTLWVDDAAVSYRPGTFGPAPNLGPISPSFFGMHVANFLQGRLRNSGLEPPFHAVGVNNAISGEIAADWNDNSSWSAVTVTYSQDTDHPHGGAAAQKIDVQSIPSGGAVQFIQQLSVVPGAAYTLSVWMRGDPGARVRLVLQNTNQPYNWYANTPLNLTAGWQQFSTTGVVNDTGAVLLMIRAEAPGIFSVDDATFTDASGQAVSGGVPWPAAGFGTLRLWDSGTSWTSLEPLKGVWNWEPLDTWVEAAASRGAADILLTLGQSPPWASSSPDTVNYVGAGAPAPPADIQDWRDYITAVAQRYKGRIRYYEIWNEPNDPTYYTGTVPQLAELTREAYRILKAIDPGNTVVAPVPYSAGYVDQLLAAGIGNYVDMLAYHIYTYTNLPEQAGRDLATVRLVMAKYGLDWMPLWDTEGASGDTTTPPDIAARYIARRYLTELAFGSIRFDWYSWGQASKFCAGTEENDPRVLTPAAKAYRYLFGWLAGATLNQAVIDAAGNWQIWLTRPDAGAGLVVWNPSETTQLTLPASFTARSSHDLSGGVRSVQRQTVTVTDSPVLLTSTEDGPPAVTAAVNAAGAGNGIAPGGRVKITGSGLASAADQSGFVPLPIYLAGASVSLNGVDCPLVYVDPGEVLFQVPYATPLGDLPLTVSSPAGLSAAFPITVSEAGPAILQWFGGRAIAFNADGSLNGLDAPAAANATMQVLLIGIGRVTPAVADGQNAPVNPVAVALNPASARIGAAAAAVQSLGLVPGYVGLAVAAILVPALPAGDYPLVITIAGVASTAAKVSVH